MIDPGNSESYPFHKRSPKCIFSLDEKNYKRKEKELMLYLLYNTTRALKFLLIAVLLFPQ